MTTLIVESCGPLTSIQDGGRRGFQHIGLPRSGALDPLALAAANFLVGNPPQTASIELLLGGITLTCFGGSVRMALAGTDFTILLDGEPIADHRSFLVHAKQSLLVRPPRRGVAAILAVEGGIDVPLVLGSRALHLRGGIGGIDGRPCRPGDQLRMRAAAATRSEMRMSALEVDLNHPLRVVMGPQAHMFPPEALRTFLDTSFEVRSESDRMAYMLAGPPIRASNAANFVSDGVAEGAIQVTGAGQLIAAFVDRQTVGGYPKIGTIIAPDRRLLAHCRPCSKVRFQAISIEAAQIEYRRYCNALRAVAVEPFASPSGSDSSKAFDLTGVADGGVSALDLRTWDFATH